VIITDVPVLTLTTKDRARRFITLIDALYERRCHLFCLAHAEPTKLFFPTDMQLAMPEVDSLTAEAFTEGEAKYRPNISAYGESISEDLPIVKPSALSLNDLSIFSGI
jgi:peroxisome-assembly ATPase